ncbi:hypothetical protein PPTG_16602 [Phytophthora nicotianae INRA-310]|uniref:PWWP domain-containing protein n=2 Tax=Phytophthora nicotianae TaxID=4792 RepID=W2PNF1_PHYN3|nr:hypothetical protein PPTG_16602 [Phytophthora nicotianae INRA-310]ETM36920.1 hypothetical protein L914_16466 [Phytophthora nicotianae]ETN02387.1 hypothetical protein PPTG_16602 [Phytophthora nicotianae INRA-310]
MSAELAAPELHEGDWIDVVDGDGIWNVAQVLRLPTPETVEVTYDCWGDEYNEELRRDSERIAPFHTHTWAVKCWAKLDTWPWWPALLTVRAPGSAQGSQNLRLEGRLLVDFLDKVEFKERCRCWVEKSKVVAFQSDEEAKEMLTKLKTKKNKSKGGVRLKNLALSTELLAMCDALEDFPEFVEGTLPVQFNYKFTRPTAEVRKEMGEEIWMRGFADNRVNHASTHAYIPVFPDDSNSDSGNIAKAAEKTGPTTTRARDRSSHDREDSDSLPDTGKDDAPSTSIESNNVASENNGITAQNPKSTLKRTRTSDEVDEFNNTDTQNPKNSWKRTRLRNDDETSGNNDCQENETNAKGPLNSDNTDAGQAGKAKTHRKRTQEIESNTKKTQAAKVDASNSLQHKGKEKSLKPGTKEIRVSPRKYGKTPKVLRSQRRAAASLPRCTLPHARVLIKEKPRNEHKNAHRPSHSSHARHVLRAKEGVADKSLETTDQQKTSAAGKRSTSSESKADDGNTSPMKSLARLTKATVLADEKLQDMETALEDKLTELAEKSARVEALRNKCAALQTRVRSPTAAPAGSASQTQLPQKVLPLETSLARSSTSIPASETLSIRKEASRREKKANGRPSDTRVPAVARRSSQAKCSIRGLELVLDDIISKDLNHNLSAATTPAELESIKVELLKSPEVQAAIARIQHPSYATFTQDLSGVTGLSPCEASSLSGDNNRRAWEKAKSRFNKYASVTGPIERRPSPRSPSQQLGRLWDYQRESESNTERFQSPSSILLDPLPADQSSFGFSVNDNFSMNQWYRDLYPKTFGFQRP